MRKHEIILNQEDGVDKRRSVRDLGVLLIRGSANKLFVRGFIREATISYKVDNSIRQEINIQ